MIVQDPNHSKSDQVFADGARSPRDEASDNLSDGLVDLQAAAATGETPMELDPAGWGNENKVIELDAGVPSPVQGEYDFNCGPEPDDVPDLPQEHVRQATPEPPPGVPKYTRRPHHGYATVEVHKTAARVLRWEFVDEERDENPADVLRRREWFEIAEWLGEMPISDRLRARYFEIERHRRGAPWKNLDEFYKSIDSLEHGPEWTEEDITVTTDKGSETFQLRKRCPIALVRHLLGLARLREHMCYSSEKHFTVTVDGRRIRVYSEMWTGEWWARMQNLIGKDVMLVPLIIASDQTNLTKLSGSKVSWPVYLSIGNIRKAVRRRPSKHATLLLGYIPVAKLQWISDPVKRREKKWELYHAAMARILEPLKEVSRDGIEVRCADGGVQLAFPILAAHIGDWPEHCTVGSTNNTRCPVCVSPFTERGDLGPPANLRTKAQTVIALRQSQQGFSATRVGLGLRPALPYWFDHPWAAGPASIQPDLLHQLWKGMYLTHLFAWWKGILSVDEMDARFKGMPRYPGHRHFTVGISPITQWTGNEARATARCFLPMLAGEEKHDAVRCARCIMDFTYRARMPQLDEDDLQDLENDLAEFHQYKEVFRRLRVHTSRYGFNGISKLHILRHYAHLIREMGTPDNFSTDGPERLHIDFVKVPYQLSNGVNPEPQMVTYLQRLEAWAHLRYELEDERVISRRRRRGRPDEEPIDEDILDEDEGEDEDMMEVDEAAGDDVCELGKTTVRGLWETNQAEAPIVIRVKDHEVFRFDPRVLIALRPTFRNIPGSYIILHHHATTFIEVVSDYVRQFDANLASQLDEHAVFGVYSRFTLAHDPLPFAPLLGRNVELVRASPIKRDYRGQVTRPAFFDTVLLDDFPESLGLMRYRAARVRAIFLLPRYCLHRFPDPLAFVELFQPFSIDVSQIHRLPTVQPWIRRGKRVCAVVPLTKIRSSCQLVPKYSTLDADLQITAHTDTLSLAERFFLGRHSTYYFFSVMDHWRRMTANQD